MMQLHWTTSRDYHVYPCVSFSCTILHYIALYCTCCQSLDHITSSKRLCQFCHMFIWEISPCILFTPCRQWRWDPTSQHALCQLLNANVRQIQTEEKTPQEKQGMNTVYMYIQLYTCDEGHHDWECLNKAMQRVHASDFWSAILVRRVIFFFLLFHSCPVGPTSDGMQTRAITLTSRLSLEYKILESWMI